MAYIDREKLIQWLEDDLKLFGNPDINYKPISYGGLCEALEVLSFVKKTPTANVEEVRHGEWIREDKPFILGGVRKCSLCGYNQPVGTNVVGSRYCSDCGAKMDGGKAE